MCVEGSSKYDHCPDPIDSWNPPYHMETPPPLHLVASWSLAFESKAILSWKKRWAKQYIYIY